MQNLRHQLIVVDVHFQPFLPQRFHTDLLNRCPLIDGITRNLVLHALK